MAGLIWMRFLVEPLPRIRRRARRLYRRLGQECRHALKAAVVADIPLGRLGSLADMANTCLFLGSDLATYVSGTVLAVDGADGKPRVLEPDGDVLDGARVR